MRVIPLPGERIERAISKGILASELAFTGAAIGGLPGAAAGAIAGLIVGDATLVFPVPMVAVPAHEYSAILDGKPPSMQIYINAGEVLTQVQPTEVQETQAALEAKPRKKRKKLNKWQRFSKQFQFRKQRQSETNKQYFAARSTAASKAYKKTQKGGGK